MSKIKFPLSARSSIRALHPIILDAEGDVVARIPMSRTDPHALSPAEAEAFAETIVRCVNSHDALVTQLRDALELIELLRANSFDRVLVEDQQITPMCAALAAAGAQP